MTQLGYGLISCQRVPGDGRSWTDLYDEAIRLVEHAERRGFGSVWTTEHHFVDDGYMPSVLPVSAAIAARTSRITVGTGLVLAPLYHPLRLAEDAATVALISKDRLVLGLGLGWSGVEFEAFGASLRTRGRAMEEMLSILGTAWRGEPVRHHGGVYELPEVLVRPVPRRPVPVVIGGTADAAVARAARLTDGFFSNAPPDRFREQVAVAKAALERAGKDPDAFRWLYYALTYPCADAETGWDELAPHAWAIRWKYADMEASATRRGGPAVAPSPPAATLQQIRAAALVGTGEQIAARIADLAAAAGPRFEFVARSYFPAMGFARQTELLDQLAEEVAPLLAATA